MSVEELRTEIERLGLPLNENVLEFSSRIITRGEGSVQDALEDYQSCVEDFRQKVGPDVDYAHEFQAADRRYLRELRIM